MGSDDEKVYRIDKRILEEQAKKKLEPIPCVKNISVDEVAWQKWHKYITNVVDADKRLVIWNHKGRGKYILNNFFKKLGPKKCKQIESAGMDGARGYIQSTKENAPRALIVYDKFHINQKLNQAIDTVRRSELSAARNSDNKELKRFNILEVNDGSY